MQNWVSLLFFCLPVVTFSQTASQKIAATIDQLFNGMRSADSTMVRQTFHPQASMQTLAQNREGKTVVRTDGVQGFLTTIATPRPQVLDERLLGKEIKVDGKMAMAWTPYKFYLGDTFSHCGVNLFTLVEVDGEWKILTVIDTRRKEGCDAMPEATNAVHLVLDNWHLAAGTANWEGYFNPMTEDSFYLGTDATERWTKAQFQAFAKPYFDKGKAWNFKAYNREVIFDEEGTTVWFDELLETWMGTCRGSGVLQKIDGEWKIKHYNLSMLVPNDKIDGYLKLLKGE